MSVDLSKANVGDVLTYQSGVVETIQAICDDGYGAYLIMLNGGKVLLYQPTGHCVSPGVPFDYFTITSVQAGIPVPTPAPIPVGFYPHQAGLKAQVNAWQRDEDKAPVYPNLNEYTGSLVWCETKRKWKVKT